MIREKNAIKRGFEQRPWGRCYYAFSFENYLDPEYPHYRSLQVLNEYYLEPGKMLGPIQHKDIEVLTYLLSGSVQYRDNVGKSSLVQGGEAQLLSCGQGLIHQEHNINLHHQAHFLQFWFYPNQHGFAPEMQQKSFSEAAKWGQWALIVSPNGREGSLRIRQEVEIYAAILEVGQEIDFDALPERFYWLQVLRGSFMVQGILLQPGDSLSLDDQLTISVQCEVEGELLLIDQA